MVVCLPCGSWSVNGLHSVPSVHIIFVLPTSSTGAMESRTTAHSLRVHPFGDCKPQFAWAQEMPGTSLFVHWNINHARIVAASPRAFVHVDEPLTWLTRCLPSRPCSIKSLRALPSLCADIKCSISGAKARYKVAESYHTVNERA